MRKPIFQGTNHYSCDPFKLLKKKISKGVRKIDSELVANLKIKPGQKLCRNCIKKAAESREHSAQETEIYDYTEEEYQCSNTSKLTLNESASLLGISPIKGPSTKNFRISWQTLSVKGGKGVKTNLLKSVNFQTKVCCFKL